MNYLDGGRVAFSKVELRFVLGKGPVVELPW
jgi:hypothetical protein